MHTAVNIDVALVGDGIERGGASANVGYCDRAGAKEWVGTAFQFLVQALYSLNKGNGLVEGVIAAFRRTGMATAALEGDADFGTPAMAAIDVHRGRFAN